MNTNKAILLILFAASIIFLGGPAYAGGLQSYSTTDSTAQNWEQFARRGGGDVGYDDSRGRQRGGDHFEDSDRHRSDHHEDHHRSMSDDDGSRSGDALNFDDSGHHSGFDDSGHHGGDRK
ncbi:MAG: hypothetical protein WAW37_12025 [Syntrophobacteraceae bacterium]